MQPPSSAEHGDSHYWVRCGAENLWGYVAALSENHQEMGMVQEVPAVAAAGEYRLPMQELLPHRFDMRAETRTPAYPSLLLHSGQRLLSYCCSRPLLFSYLAEFGHVAVFLLLGHSTHLLVSPFFLSMPSEEKSAPSHFLAAQVCSLSLWHHSCLQEVVEVVAQHHYPFLHLLWFLLF